MTPAIRVTTSVLEQGGRDTQATFSRRCGSVARPHGLSVRLLASGRLRDWPLAGLGLLDSTSCPRPPQWPCLQALVPVDTKAAPGFHLAPPQGALPPTAHPPHAHFGLWRSCCLHKDATVFLPFGTFSLETLVKIPSFPFGEGMEMTDGGRPPRLAIGLRVGRATVREK